MINKVLASMTYNPKYNSELTSYIMQYLTRLIRNNYKFAALVLETIDLG